VAKPAPYPLHFHPRHASDRVRLVRPNELAMRNDHNTQVLRASLRLQNLFAALLLVQLTKRNLNERPVVACYGGSA